MGLLNTLFIPLCLIYCLVLVQSIKRPVIGILMQKAYQNNTTKAPKNNDYVVFSNYVKALEGSGAVVVPIFINQDITYYMDIIKKINGIVFPGGSADLQDPTDIGKAGEIIYRLAAEMNDRGEHLPILGICQGFQLLATASAGMKRILTRCYGLENIGLPLKFMIKPSESYFFQSAPTEVIKILETEPVTANVHDWCVTSKSLEEHGVLSEWRVISVDEDSRGLQFITSMEHKRYPFVAVQFHPEKSIYDFAEGFEFPTHLDAILANRWFYDSFVHASSKMNNENRYQGVPTNHIMENYCSSLVFEKGFGMIDKYLFTILDSDQNEGNGRTTPQHTNRPTTTTPQHTNRPTTTTPQHTNRPTTTTPQHTNRPTTTTPQHTYRPSTTTLEHTNRPTTTTPQHTHRPTTTTPKHTQRPTTTTPQHKNRPTTTTPQQKNRPTPGIIDKVKHYVKNPFDIFG